MPGVGDKFNMWEKVMKEVTLGCFAGPFTKDTLPFENIIQSPIGLVPKAGNQTRLIFHLSFKFANGNESVNFWTPEDECSVKYNDLDHAVRNTLRILKQSGARSVFYAKTDLKSAFCAAPLLPSQYFVTCLKVFHPITGKELYMIDKNLPFGSSKSCAIFQSFSEGLRHIIEGITGKKFHITNYLDDFLFIDWTAEACDQLVRTFLDVCEYIGFPVALEKTVWSTHRIVFLGILLHGYNKCLSLPEDKRLSALNRLSKFLDSKKATVRELQQLAGTLNFLCKAVHPGRVFVRRMYSKFSFPTEVTPNKKNSKLKPFHHVRLDREFHNDCRVWVLFLEDLEAVNRPYG